jgi:hypothetical protein
MNPNAVFSASLITSLVLWFPSMQACLRGDLDLAPAGLRYVAALTVSRLAWSFLCRLITSYRATHEPPAATTTQSTPAPAQPPSPEATPHRRRSDATPEVGADQNSLAA